MLSRESCDWCRRSKRWLSRSSRSRSTVTGMEAASLSWTRLKPEAPAAPAPPPLWPSTPSRPPPSSLPRTASLRQHGQQALMPARGMSWASLRTALPLPLRLGAHSRMISPHHSCSPGLVQDRQQQQHSTQTRTASHLLGRR